MDRREFLKRSGLLPAALWAPQLFAAGSPYRNRILILLELKGGNDGLNTVIPFADPAYARLRPRLGVGRDAVVRLDEQTGLNPALQPLLSAWQAGDLAIVQGVGYPDPNRSHFRSIEIWETGADAREFLAEGWLAPVFREHPLPAGGALDGVVLDANPGPLLGTRNVPLRQPARFLRQARRSRPATARVHNPALDHILAVQQETRQAAEVLAEWLAKGSNPPGGFPNTAIGRQCQTAAWLIEARLPLAVIKLSHGSFDTHSNQRRQHDRLLGQLAGALAALRERLRQAGRWDEVLIMSYSEFGRRAAENGSAGTDHGTAAPHFLLGGRVRGGLHGQAPSLTRLLNGDLQFHVDFRRLYATVIQ
ncbi:MAG TPA: DUF1501 domain-containing protein, partial [Chromatiales bacterium]|nr:DUF1501 domain-containing protein [Chromatiales bacterium]